MSTAGARSYLHEAFQALRADLVHENGPRISTMRNYRFAIVPYAPADEFELRRHVQTLTSDLRAHGWEVLPISLYGLLIDRVRAMGEDTVARIIDMERRTAEVAPERGLRYLASKLTGALEGPDGIAGDCARLIAEFADRHPDKAERTLALIGRAAALYPFFRSSALLKHLDGRTRNIPVVLLYPGERRGDSGLSFMGEVEPDRDYRPRIYP